MEYLRVFEAFSGYGSQSMALKRLGIDFEVVGISEIDKYAIQAYNSVHGETKNYGDISKINWNDVPDFDFLTYSFPCTDISSAGQQKGLEEGSGTRSSLLWECRKAIETKKPKYLMMENVKALTSKKFMPYLKMWMNYLSELGYSNYAQVLNAKDYGVPQNRERVFVVSVKGKSDFSFLEPFILDRNLESILDNNIEEGFYLNDDAVRIDNPVNEKMLVKYTRDKKVVVVGRRLSSTSNTVHTSTGSGGNTDCFVFEPKIIQVANIRNEKNFKNPQCGRVYSPFGISPTIDTMCGGQREPKILTNDYRIRKLTPRECFRLMGVSDEDIDKIQAAGISKTQQYKMAGNSIVVDVLYHIFRKMFINKKDENQQLSLF